MHGIHWPLVNSENQDQTAQNVQSRLEPTLFDKEKVFLTNRRNLKVPIAPN